MGKLAQIAVILASVATMTGCGRIDFKSTLLRPLPSVAQPSAKGVEVVSGSTVGQRTANNYLVDAQVGAVTSQLEATTANGYKVYYGVGGAVASDSTTH